MKIPKNFVSNVWYKGRNERIGSEHFKGKVEWHLFDIHETAFIIKENGWIIIWSIQPLKDSCI